MTATPLARAPRPDRTPGAEIADALSHHDGAPGTLLISMPAPVVEASAAFCALGGDHPFLWDPPDGPCIVAAGAAKRLDLDPDLGVSALIEEARQLESELIHCCAHDVEPAPAKLLGGMAFDPSGADPARDAQEWAAFGPGSFVLPRWQYTSDGAAATMTIATRADRRLTEGLIADYDRFVGNLANPPIPRHSGPTLISGEPIETWRRRLQAIDDQITSGSAQKIITARRAVVRAAQRFDPYTLIRRLAARERSAIRFACGRESAILLGATPERLIARHGCRVTSEALAGSAAAGADAARLTSSDKNLAEHGFVARFVYEQLTKRCRWVHRPDRPTARHFTDVTHLATPITGVLDAPTHVLELVDALHPTPAVGGAPSSAALAFIRAWEPASRGWYAGPIGWFDVKGDGAFAVALRCGLIDGDRAFVYAGAGIVEGSDAASEYAETELKQRAVLAALGVR